MSGNPRENTNGLGFWDGGTRAHGNPGEGSGRASGTPGRRNASTVGVRIDLELPIELESDTDKLQSTRTPHR
jgi:hypothetical protein